MMGGTLRRGCLAALACIALTAGAAQAQPRDTLPSVREDSLGLAADAEPIPHRRLTGMGRCGLTFFAVVADTADLRRLRLHGQCADAPLPEPVGRTLVGVSIRGDCHMVYRLNAFRSESRREFRVRLQRRYGGCRAGGSANVWLELPALPEGWSVAFTDEEVDERPDTLLGEWIYIRARDPRD